MVIWRRRGGGTGRQAWVTAVTTGRQSLPTQQLRRPLRAAVARRHLLGGGKKALVAPLVHLAPLALLWFPAAAHRGDVKMAGTMMILVAIGRHRDHVATGRGARGRKAGTAAKVGRVTTATNGPQWPIPLESGGHARLHTAAKMAKKTIAIRGRSLRACHASSQGESPCQNLRHRRVRTTRGSRQKVHITRSSPCRSLWFITRKSSPITCARRVATRPSTSWNIAIGARALQRCLFATTMPNRLIRLLAVLSRRAWSATCTTTLCRCPWTVTTLSA